MTGQHRFHPALCRAASDRPGGAASGPRPANPYVRLLRGSQVFATLDEDSLSRLAARGRRHLWPAGAMLFQRGDEGDFLVAVVSGRVRLSVSSPSGRELVLRHVGPGEVTGEFALIDGQPRSADATAVEPVEAMLLSREAFLGVAAERPELGIALARHLCSLLRTTNYQMESVSLYGLRSRVARFIVLTLRELHGDDIPEESPLRLGVNQTEFAAILGASRPKVNQVLQALIADGVLLRDGETLICRRDALLDVAAEAALGEG